jgi:hypothetical protein
VRVGDGDLVGQRRTVLEFDLHTAAEGLLVRVDRVVAAGPLGILGGLDLVPQLDGVGPGGTLGSVGVLVVPALVLHRHGEDVHDRVVERLTAGLRIHLLRVVGAGADDVVGVVRGVDDDALDLRQVLDLTAELAGEVDERLRLVLGRVLLGVCVEDGALGLSLTRKRDGVAGLGTGEDPGDEAVFTFVDRVRCALSAHRTVDGLDGHLAGEGRCVGLPGRDLALARLAGRRRHVQGLLDGLEGDLGGQVQHGADAGSGRGAEVGDVIDLVLVQAHALDEVDLDLIARGHTVDEVLARDALVLGDGEDRRDVVAGVGVFGGEERVMEVELAHGDAVGPGCPFRGEAVGQRQTEDGSTRGEGVGLRLLAGVHRG